MKNADVQLNLSQVLTRATQLPQDETFDLYYDPDTHYFYLYPYNTLKYWIPLGASFLGRGRAENMRLTIESFIGNAVYRLIREVRV